MTIYNIQKTYIHRNHKKDKKKIFNLNSLMLNSRETYAKNLKKIILLYYKFV